MHPAIRKHARPLTALALLLALLLCACARLSPGPAPASSPPASGSTTAPSTPQPAPSPAAQRVRALGVGWNLGNTLDSCDFKKQGIRTPLADTTAEIYYETFWGNPVTTADMIQTVADMGFGTVRIPVTWYDHMDDQFQISPAWLQRVEEIVNYVLDSGMYCIINLHHDAGRGTWLKADPTLADTLQANLETVWAQISAHFQPYDDRLLFEGFNELLDADGNWTEPNAGTTNVVNTFNQTFVDTVRATGGNNATRFLIVNTYAGGIDDDILNAFVLPQDTVDGHLIAQVHSYVPHGFTWLPENTPWSENYADWDPARDTADIDALFKRLNTCFTEKGIPFIIGEFAAWNKNNTADRAAFAAYYVTSARRYGGACFWWDDGGQYDSAETVGSAALLNRAANQWYYPEIAQALVEAAAGQA